MLLGGQSDFEAPNVQRVINPVLHPDSATSINVVESAENYQINYKVADSANSSSIVFNLSIPSNTLVGRTLTIEVPFRLTATVPSGAGLPYQPGYAGFRANPLSQYITAAQLNINGAVTNCQIGSIIYGAWQLMTEEERALYGPLAYQDTYQNMAQFPTTSNNPLSTYNDSSQYHLLPRGSMNGFTNGGITTPGNFTITNIASVTPGEYVGYTVTGVLREQIQLLSPLVSGPMGNVTKALAGVNTLGLTLQLVNNPKRIWEHLKPPSGVGDITSIQFDVLENCRLAVEQWKPSVPYDSEVMRLYAYNNIVSYQSNGGSVAANTISGQMTSSNISLSVVPSKILIWCRRDDTLRDYNTTDTFLAPQTLSITYDNKPALLTTLSDFDLWQLSRKNGLNCPYPQWSNYTGGVIVVDVAADLGVSNDEFAGVIGKHQVQVNATFKNTSNATISNCQLFVCVILPGSVTLGRGQCLFNEGLLTSEQAKMITSLAATPGEYTKTLRQNSVYGSSVFSDAWDGAKYAAQLAAPTLVNMAARAALGGAQIGGAKPKMKRAVSMYKPRRAKGAGYGDVEQFSMNNLEERLQGMGYESE